jgi:hypothetical protein
MPPALEQWASYYAFRAAERQDGTRGRPSVQALRKTQDRCSGKPASAGPRPDGTGVDGLARSSRRPKRGVGGG